MHLRAAQWLKDLAKNALLPVAVFLLAIYGYAQLAAWSGTFHADRFFSQWIELVIVIYLFGYFVAIQKPHRLRLLLAGLPIVLAYFAQDLYFHFYGRVMRLVEVIELPELFSVLPLSYLFLLIAIFIVPLLAYLAQVNFRNLRYLVLGVLPIIAIFLVIELMPKAYANFIETMGNQIVIYSDGKSVESNGRFTMLLYREALRIQALMTTASYRDQSAYAQEGDKFAEKLKVSSNQRNIHLILLESFLDPTLFNSLKFSRDPVHPAFRELFGENLGFSLSPVFGGGTAQAEFEALCGVPALEKLTSIEFNLFTGSPVNCMPGILDRLGYRTVATNAYKPNFFNAQPAYKGIGFQEIYFPREFAGSNPTYFKAGAVGGEDFMFDGNLFKQNLAFVERHLKEHPEKPLLNYIMTIYGHTPHMLDNAIRPEIIQIESDHPDPHLKNVVNQFYYRTQAIAEFVKQLRVLDPNSLIVLAADHVPPLVYGPNTYRDLNYMGNIENSYYHNRIMIVENGKPKAYNTIHHYHIPQLLFNYLSGGQYCEQVGCAHLDRSIVQDKLKLLPDYFRLMAHASL